MKTKILLIGAVLLIAVNVQAQFINLHDFNGTNGNAPEGTLTLSGKVLYGMAAQGGANSHGCIFSIDTNGSNYKDLYDFNGRPDGAAPEGKLLLSGKKLYGVTEIGGTNDSGCVFSIDTNGSGYKILLSFNGINGKYSYFSALIISGKVLYGMASLGGVNDDGLIFSIDTNGNNYKDVFNFNGINGTNPVGSLTLSLSGSILYGMTDEGGLHDSGCIFSIDTNGLRYKDIFDFNGTNGRFANSTLTLSGKVLYGTTQSGGANNSGCVFSVDTNGSNYKDLLDFNITNGRDPAIGALILSGKALYGTTQSGGLNGHGCAFSIDTNGSNYKDLWDFDDTGSNGMQPTGMLIVSGNNLYGLTLEGGIGNNGVIYKLNDPTITTSIPDLKFGSYGLNLYPNPNKGLFTISILKASEKADIEIYSIMGGQVYKGSLNPSTTQINLSSQPAGLYLYRVVTDEGQLISSGKLIIQ